MTSYSSSGIINSSQTKLAETMDEDFYIGTGSFEFPNGDVYEGGYVAHRSGLIWKEGLGTYKTKDGQIYTGSWYNDKLTEQQELNIIYADGSQYIGDILDNKYNGPAIYRIDNDLNLFSEFFENKPVGEVTLLDINGRIWGGTAGEFDCLLLPEHVFFSDLPKDLGKGKRTKKFLTQEQKEEKRKKITTRSSIVSTKSVPGMPSPSGILKTIAKMQSTELQYEEEREKEREKEKEKKRKLEMKIFAKTKKTLSDLKFEDSRWYQDYQNFKEYYENVIKKIEKSGFDSLNEEERQWNTNYMEFRKRYQEIMDRRQKKEKKLEDYDLWELFTSEEYKKSYPPVRIIYPSSVESLEQVRDGESIETKS